jgi:hypothetical protein
MDNFDFLGYEYFSDLFGNHQARERQTTGEREGERGRK